VLRPIDTGIVGRTMLRPPTELLELNPTLITSSDTVSVFGTPLTTTGAPFCTQDGEYLRCAHAAIWVCQQIARRKDLTGPQATADLVSYAPPELQQDRALPSLGLNDEQIQAIFTNIGIPALSYPVDAIPLVLGVDQPPERPLGPDSSLHRKKAERDKAVVTLCCRYLRSGFPVLIATEWHIFVIVGFFEYDPGGYRHIRFIACDDQVGPYEIVNPFRYDRKRGRWETIIVPLPPRAWLTGEGAENDAYDRLTAHSDLPLSEWAEPGQGLETGHIQLHTQLLRGRNYKHALPQQSRAPEVVKALRLAHLSRYVWVVEAHDETKRRAGEPSVVAELIYDYTSSELPRPRCLAISYQGATTIFPPEGGTPRRIPVDPKKGTPPPWRPHDQLTAADTRQ
jgi:hypothetical protein